MHVKADVITALPSIPGNWHKSVVEGIPQKIFKHKLHNVLININIATATYSYLSDFRYFPTCVLPPCSPTPNQGCAASKREAHMGTRQGPFHKSPLRQKTFPSRVSEAIQILSLPSSYSSQSVSYPSTHVALYHVMKSVLCKTWRVWESNLKPLPDSHHQHAHAIDDLKQTTMGSER